MKAATNTVQNANTLHQHVRHMIQPCGNMVNKKCMCDQILLQNKDANKIWSNCHHIHIRNKYKSHDNRQIILVYFDALFFELSQYFKQQTGTTRMPSTKDIAQSILDFGGFCVDNNHDIVIDRCHFIQFWRWYRGAVSIIQQNATLWSTRFPFQIDLFMDRQQSSKILVNMPEGMWLYVNQFGIARHRLMFIGTFILRLSRSKLNGLVISYLKKEFDGQLSVRNILLNRQFDGKYVANGSRAMTLAQLIRSFVKLKYIYTPNYIYNKSHLF